MLGMLPRPRKQPFYSFLSKFCEELISHSRAHRICHLATALHFHRQLSRLSCLHTCSLACHWIHTCITLCTCWLSAGDFFVQASGYIKIGYQVSCFLNEKTKPYSISHIWKNQLMYRALCLQWLSDIYHPEPMRINWANQTVENGQLWASSTKSDCFLSSYPSEACHLVSSCEITLPKKSCHPLPSVILSLRVSLRYKSPWTIDLLNSSVNVAIRDCQFVYCRAAILSHKLHSALWAAEWDSPVKANHANEGIALGLWFYNS